MFIDMHVHPTFFEPISENNDIKLKEFRQNSLNIHQNSIAPLEHIYNQMKCANLDKLCLLPHDYSSIYGRAIVSNEDIHKIVNLNKNAFIGFASVDPFTNNCLEKLDYAFNELKLSGLKLNPSKLKFYPYDERLLPIYDMCVKYNKPIIFHSGFSWEDDTLSKYSRPIEFEELALKYKKLRICLAHFGWPWVQETAMLMSKYRNIYADTALLYFDSAKEFFMQVFTKDIPITWIERSIRHQVMFGSNNPRFEQIRMANSILDIGFTTSTLDLIKYKNALDFLNI